VSGEVNYIAVHGAFLNPQGKEGTPSRSFSVALREADRWTEIRNVSNLPHFNDSSWLIGFDQLLCTQAPWSGTISSPHASPHVRIENLMAAIANCGEGSRQGQGYCEFIDGVGC
jgi:hypothetical protein